MTCRDLWRFILPAWIAVVTISVFTSCSSNVADTHQQSPQIRRFSGTVQDGYLGKALCNAVVSFVGLNGLPQTVIADSNALFHFDVYIGREVLFTVKVGNCLILPCTTYTSARMSVVVWGDSINDTTNPNMPINSFRDTAVVVPLYPLLGKVVGKIQARKHDFVSAVAVVGAEVVGTFDTAITPAMAFSTPHEFSTVTDSNGTFSLSGLPLASGFCIRVTNGTAEGLRYLDKSATVLGQLSRSGVISVGTIILDRTVSSLSFRYLSNNFPTGNVSPADSLIFNFSDTLDTISNAFLLNQKVNPTIVSTKIFIEGSRMVVVPVMELIPGSAYELSIIGCGKKGGSSVETFLPVVR